MTELQKRLGDILERWSLLAHPFHRSWRAGTLPEEALRAYAQEYGAFIYALPIGWGAVGEIEALREEHEHARLWDSFAASLNTYVSTENGFETRELILTARRLFGDPVAALGALYAFEAQQSEISASNLNGLRTFYDLPSAAHTYFESHLGADHEARLLERLAALSPEDRERAVEACETMARAMWGALTGVLPEPLRAEMAEIAA